MEYYVSQAAETSGDGSREKPFQSIGQAAQLAQAGDEVIISDGIYREWVSPKNSGTQESPIVYRAAEGAKPVISGAEEIKGWAAEKNGVWSVTIDNDFFGDYNPYACEIYGDWYHNGGQTHHTGEVFFDDEAMYEEKDLASLYRETPEKKERVRRWFAVTDERQTKIYARFACENPMEHQIEISVRPFGFFPKETGVDYIAVSGLTICCVATQWAPPTAFQPGAIGPHYSKGWTIEHCTVYNSKCSGISLGRKGGPMDNAATKNPIKDGTQRQLEAVLTALHDGWSGEKVGHHTVRNNEIYNCGQSGIVGHLGAVFSDIEHNHIHHINIRNEFGGAEMAGIKLHAAIDVRIRHNCIHDCVRGVWLDWESQGGSVDANTFFHNREEDLFIEVSHGPCVVKNNLMLSKRSFFNVSQGTALVHNLIAGYIWPKREIYRSTPYHMPHSTFIQGYAHIYGGDDRIVNNIFFAAKGQKNVGTTPYKKYAISDLPSDRVAMRPANLPEDIKNLTFPVMIRDNIYVGKAKSIKKEPGARHLRGSRWTLEIRFEDGHYYLITDIFSAPESLCVPRLSAKELGRAFQAEYPYEERDGREADFSYDFDEAKRAEQTLAGPFSAPVQKIKLV